MTTPVEWLDDIRSSAQAGNLALVCGTGISARVTDGHPVSMWKGLILDAIEYFESVYPEATEVHLSYKSLLEHGVDAAVFISVAQYVKSTFKTLGSVGEYRRWLERTVGSLPIKNTDLSTVFDLNLPVITTNYDSIIEKLSARRSPLVWTEADKLDRIHKNPGDYVFHLHGHFDSPDSVVLSGGDYARIEFANHAARAIEPIAASYTLLMVGYGAGLADPTMNTFLTWFDENWGSTVRRIYVLKSAEEMPDAALERNLAYVCYGQRADLASFLTDLLGCTAQDEQSSPGDISDNSKKSNKRSGENLLLGGLPPAVRQRAITEIGETESWSEFQVNAIAAGVDAIANRSSALFSAVTGIGKTTVARVLMNSVIPDNSAAVMILPTKALVAQEDRAWRKWEKAWDDDGRQILVYPASRDYPENDATVSKGRFQIALAIYEKLSAYIVSQRNPLGSTLLLVVDELQTLVDEKDRGAKLEALLTMVRLMRKDERPAIIGLSATMSKESTRVLRAWLGVSDDAFVQSGDRPVDLNTYVVDAVTWRLQRKAHLFNIGIESSHTTPPPPVDERHELMERVQGQTIKVHRLSTAPLAVALVCKMLNDDPSRRVIVFVPGRTAATELCDAIRQGLKREFGRLDPGNPWIFGRFASESMEKSVAEARFHELKHSDIPLSDHVILGLRTGVAYHSARLSARLRRMLEDEFRDAEGVLRVLVATDTLAQGVNLPADTVIATSLSTFGSNRKLSLSTPAELDNKAGRAGRRGTGVARPNGEFYLLVPSARDLEDVGDLTASAKKALSTVEGVFDKYVVGRERTPKVVGRIRELDDVAQLTLLVLSSDGHARRPERFRARVEAVIASLLAAEELDVKLPTADEVIARLTALDLVSVSSSSGKARPTQLGEAVSRAGTSIESARILERLARLATYGAGDIDLLFNACRSNEIEDVTAWVGLPSVPRRHFPSLKEQIISYGLAYCAESAERRHDCAQLVTRKGYALPSELVLQGQKVVSQQLSDLFIQDAEAVDDRDANALLRALVAYEWSRGIPFSEIKARFSSAIISEEVRPGERPVELRLHYSDVEQLCEQIAGLVRGSADVSYSEHHDWSSRVRLLALQTEVGLPAWLAPIAKMRIEALHRNRLALLWADEPLVSDWAGILDLPALAAHAGINDKQRQAAKDALENREQQEKIYRHRVAQQWSTELVPGLDGVEFEELSEQLTEAAGADEYARIIGGVGAGLGAQVSYASDASYAYVVWKSQENSLKIAIADHELGESEVEAVRDTDCLVMLRTRLRPSSYSALARTSSVARFVQPEVVLASIARLVNLRGDALQIDEILQLLLSLKVSVLDAESAIISVDPPTGPPPFVGAMPQFENANSLFEVHEGDVD